MPCSIDSKIDQNAQLELYLNDEVIAFGALWDKFVLVVFLAIKIVVFAVH